MVYGIAFALAIWHIELEVIIQGILGIFMFFDDNKITEFDEESHLERLETVLKR